MKPTDRAEKLIGEWGYDHAIQVAEQMMNHYIGIDNPPFIDYWQAVYFEIQSLK